MTKPTLNTQQTKREPAKTRQPVAAPVVQPPTHPAAILQRAALDPGSLTPNDVLRLQRTIGNRAVSQLLHARHRPTTRTTPIQAKLMVGPAGDSYEQEADRVAEQVVNRPAAVGAQSAVQRQAEEEEEIQTKPLAASITPLVQRAGPEEEEELQTKPLIQR